MPEALDMLALETGAPPPLHLVVQSVGLDVPQVASPVRREPPPMLFAKPQPGVPMVAPMLRRQNASRFAWPPDPNDDWTYIRFSPEQFCEQAAFSLELELSVRQVAEFFLAEASNSAAYASYVARWRGELEACLRLAAP